MDSGKIMAFLQEHWCFAALVMGVLVRMFTIMAGDTDGRSSFCWESC